MRALGGFVPGRAWCDTIVMNEVTETRRCACRVYFIVLDQASNKQKHCYGCTHPLDVPPKRAVYPIATVADKVRNPWLSLPEAPVVHHPAKRGWKKL